MDWWTEGRGKACVSLGDDVGAEEGGVGSSGKGWEGVSMWRVSAQSWLAHCCCCWHSRPYVPRRTGASTVSAG